MHKDPNRLNVILIFLATFITFCILNTFSCNKQAHANTKSKGLGIMEALTSALKYSPDILLKDQDIRFSQGALQQSQGSFDPTLQMGTSYTDQNTPITSDLAQEVKTASYNFQINKQLRNGVALNSSADVSQVETEYSSQYPTESPQNNAGVYFTLAIPLLKGRGVEATAAGELAAKVNLEITELQSRDTISQTVLNTALGYWAYRAAFEQLKQYKQAEKRAEESLRITQAMITADQAPSSLLENTKAKLSSKKSSRILGGQILYEAQQTLGILMGIDFHSIETLPFPSDALPGGTHEKIEKLYQQKQRLIALALNRRYDFQALKKYIDYNNILLKQARNNLLPQFDLNLNTGYSGWDSGSGVGNTFSSLFKNVPGASAGISFDLLLPISNNTAKGTLLQYRANLRKYQIQVNQAARTISSNVATQLFALKQRLRQLSEAEDSVTYYAKSVKNAQKKFQLGMATLSDLLLIKDDLDLSISRKINIQQQYANALANLRYHTSTLIDFIGEGGRIGVEDLISVPDISE